MRETFYQRKSCRLCNRGNLEKVLELEPTALCDAYVTSERLSQAQEIYPLDLFLCRDCGYVHVPYVVNPDIIYPDYLYVTNSSLGLSEHFSGYAADCLRKLNLPLNSLVVDIGSNDGTLLRAFKGHGMRVLGVEPAKKIAQDATSSGVETLPEFFTPKLAAKIKKDFGAASVITINNLFANIDDLEEIAKGFRELISSDGALIIESSYLGDLIQNMIFDFIYHEHLSYFSTKPLIKFFSRFEMELFDVERVSTKGGSLRYFFQLAGSSRKAADSVAKIISDEEKAGLTDVKTFKKFSENILNIKSQLNALISKIKKDNFTIAGYGASATSTTLIYHFDLGRAMDYIVDDNRVKQDTFSPGYHIPVLSSRVLYERKPDYVLLLAWRYAKPIIKMHDKFLKQGGHFLIPLPEVKTI